MRAMRMNLLRPNLLRPKQWNCSDPVCAMCRPGRLLACGALAGLLFLYVLFTGGFGL